MKKMLLHPTHKLLIQIIIEWYPISAGLTCQILSNLTNSTAYVSSVWFQDIITSLSNNNIHVNTYHFLTMKVQRMNDRCIMYHVMQLNLTTKESIQLSACRMYLQVPLLSDIATPTRKIIMVTFLRDQKPKFPRSTFYWSYI